jgi:hypothetical protein
LSNPAKQIFCLGFLFTCGPLFTAPGGHGTEYFKNLPAPIRDSLNRQFLRLPASPEQAREQVDDLKRQGVDCIKTILESGSGGIVYNRMDTALFDAVAQEAHADNLPLVVHTGDVRDISEAIQAHATSIEHGSFREVIPEALFAKMATQGTFYDPTLSVGEAFKDIAKGDTDLLQRSLVQQVAPPGLTQSIIEGLASKDGEAMRSRLSKYPIDMQHRRRESSSSDFTVVHPDEPSWQNPN